MDDCLRLDGCYVMVCGANRLITISIMLIHHMLLKIYGKTIEP